MKTYKTIVSIILLSLFTSCHDDFLQDRAYSVITEDNFFQTSSDAITAVNSVYAALRDNGMYQTDLMMLNEYPSETVTTRLNIGSAQSNMDTWQYDVGYFSGIYNASYRLIERANQVIANVPRISMNETLKRRVIAEATFLRALAYFNLVRVFGGVPLKITPTRDFNTLSFPRASASDVYQLIIGDLEGILEAGSLPLTSRYGNADKGRVGKSAVQTLLGKVYLTRAGDPAVAQNSDYQKAIQVLQACVSDGDRTLLSSYKDIFSMTNENNAEIIFDIQYVRIAGLGGNLTAFIATGVTQEFYIIPYYDYPANIDFYNSFEVGDTRRDVTFHDRMKIPVSGTPNVEVYFDPDTDPYVGNWRRADNNSLLSRAIIDIPVPGFRKFIDDNPNARGNAEEPNYIILRYSDVLLMLAEAINEANGPTADAYNYLNMVRRRAFGKPANSAEPSVDYTNLSKEEFRRAVFSERRKELVIEGHSWFDGKRFWDIYTEKVAATSQLADPNINNRPKVPMELNRIRDDKYKLMPFSETQLDLNKELVQNPGYN
ncbi:MAG: RagB/SusD family nutrient uptake outer membrane protein [Cyclobacteriaceae bacterium]|nr:RagB/SusD family nutrient uptake outer membrane protein [Cyclobacteriaceae bacterium]